MARPRRLEFPGAIYHLTGRGNARQKVFFTDADRELFLNTLAGVVTRYHWICHAYCLMANHYHLLVETPKANLSIGMRQLNGIYAQRFNRRHHRVGHLFQGRFKAILVERESHLLELCRYIRAQSRAGQRRCSSFNMEMEQLPGHGGSRFGAGAFVHGLGTRAIWQEPVTSAAAVPGVRQGRNGESAVGRSQGSDLLRERGVHRETRFR